MFSKPMVVTADELQLRLGVDTAVVELTQTFSQGRFKDVGKKQLVIVATAAGARIAREEMLSSQLAGPIGGGDARWSFVLGHGGACDRRPLPARHPPRSAGCVPERRRRRRAHARHGLRHRQRR